MAVGTNWNTKSPIVPRLAGDALQITVQVEFDLAVDSHPFGDFLRNIETDASFSKLRQYGSGEYGPVVFRNKYAVSAV